MRVEAPKTPFRLRLGNLKSGPMATVSLRLGRNATSAQKTAAFIAKARLIHGARYDYSAVRYVNRATPVRLICPKHGAFRSTPENHIRRDSPSGCLVCRTEERTKKAAEEAKRKGRAFIARARKLHKRKYDYSQVFYVDVDSPVTIICPLHGAFYPTPWNHAGGNTTPLSGCPKCGAERGSKAIRDRHKATFVSRARRVHGDAYDYSKTVYKDARSKLTIVCAKHGSFQQVASSHLRGIGCPVCGRLKAGASVRATAKKDFLAKARRAHGRKYRYDKTMYVRASGMIVVTCPKHGDFRQTANNHLSGNGCSKCKTDKLRDAFADTKAEFVRKARSKHGRKFSYSGAYVNDRTPISIRCRKHGVFRQRPADHLKGATGCPQCGLLKIAEFHSSNHEEFLRKARVKHGNRYRYPEAYRRAATHMNVECRKHGAFPVTPNNHLRGHGCPRCQAEQAAERNRSTHEEFVGKARRVHGGKFHYPERYSAAIQPITIICPTHGKFTQTPNSHLQGRGCPRCMESLGERLVARFLESRGIRHAAQHKFADCIDKRPLRFDFWLPELMTLIEYDGPQHFQATDYYGGTAHFEATKRRDRIKTSYARKKKIRLIRVRYSVRDVEAFLMKQLQLLERTPNK